MTVLHSLQGVIYIYIYIIIYSIVNIEKRDPRRKERARPTPICFFLTQPPRLRKIIDSHDIQKTIERTPRDYYLLLISQRRSLLSQILTALSPKEATLQWR